MIYSCFNARSALYDYFEDSRQLPVNADLPVPKFSVMAGKIGVAAIDAGRPLPSDARRTGQGWHARGIIVQCGHGNGMSGSAFGSDGSPSEAWDWFKAGGWKWTLGAVVAVAIIRRW
mgnify:CR=1 FL=1